MLQQQLLMNDWTEIYLSFHLVLRCLAAKVHPKLQQECTEEPSRKSLVD